MGYFSEFNRSSFMFQFSFTKFHAIKSVIEEKHNVKFTVNTLKITKIHKEHENICLLLLILFNL